MNAESAAPLHRISNTQIAGTDSVVKKAGQRTLWAAFLGFFVDMFDVYLPVVALGPAMSYFQPATLSPTLNTTLFYVVFALSLVGRPMGATLFGYYADKIGRRKVTVISMAGFAATTLLIGLLPGYETWGIGSIATLIFLRFVDGIFLGGEYTGANPLAMENAPKEKRGKWSACIHAGFPIAMVVMALLTTGLLRVIPAGSTHSPYVQWGWRIPFFIGAILAAGASLYCLRKVPESEVWANSEKTKSPFKELFRGGNLRCLLQVFVLMSGAWFTLNAAISILPGVLLNVRHVDHIALTNAQLVANLLVAAVFVPFGMLGQKVGRRPMLILMGIAASTAGSYFYYLLVKSGYQNGLELTALVSLINLFTTPVWAFITSYVNERFPTAVRATGYGIGYSAAMIIPAFSSFYLLGLRELGIPYEYTQIVLLALGGLLLVVGALSGPETKNVDFR